MVGAVDCVEVVVVVVSAVEVVVFVDVVVDIESIVPEVLFKGSTAKAVCAIALKKLTPITTPIIFFILFFIVLKITTNFSPLA